jgi:putative oxygen-independent coproporphyrinogen III oxidase
MGGHEVSLYVHVPFCSSRCGYCDFNTYTAEELGGGVRRDTFHEVLNAEIDLAARALGERTVTTVFVGGGTPTLIGSVGLNSVLRHIDERFELAPDAEVTTEANPDSVTPQMLDELRAGGFTRISFGMQSASPAVLRILERTHTPGASTQAAGWARAAGFEHVNLDLIYGTPGESDDDLRRSLEEAVGAGVDHVSAYALIVEDGTALSRRVTRGDLAAPDDDVCADRYEIVDGFLAQAGLPWYELSNWSRPGGECRHNLAYWTGADWWGIGPGAHSHVRGERWWNVKHPTTYGQRLAEGASPEADREVLTAEQRHAEQVLLGIRLARGMSRAGLGADSAVDDLIRGGLLEQVRGGGDAVALTLRGRLLADTVTRTLIP